MISRELKLETQRERERQGWSTKMSIRSVKKNPQLWMSSLAIVTYAWNQLEPNSQKHVILPFLKTALIPEIRPKQEVNYKSCTAPKEGLLFDTRFRITEKEELSGQKQDQIKDIYSVRGGELWSLLWTSGCCVFPFSLFLMGVLNCSLLVSTLPRCIG